MSENKRAREVKKTDCLVIGWSDGETPEVIPNGTNEDLKRGAKLFCEFSEVERLEKEAVFSSAQLRTVRDQRNDVMEMNDSLEAELKTTTANAMLAGRLSADRIAELESLSQRQQQAIEKLKQITDGFVQSYFDDRETGSIATAATKKKMTEIDNVVSAIISGNPEGK